MKLCELSFEPGKPPSPAQFCLTMELPAVKDIGQNTWNAGPQEKGAQAYFNLHIKIFGNQHPGDIENRNRQGQIAQQPVGNYPGVLVRQGPGQAQASVPVKGQPGRYVPEEQYQHNDKPADQVYL